jgi:hypothetical protein
VSLIFDQFLAEQGKRQMVKERDEGMVYVTVVHLAFEVLFVFWS